MDIVANNGTLVAHRRRVGSAHSFGRTQLDNRAATRKQFVLCGGEIRQVVPVGLALGCCSGGREVTPKENQDAAALDLQPAVTLIQPG